APAAQAVLDLVSRIGYLAPAHVAAVQGTGAEMARRHLRALEDLGAVMAWVPGEPGYPPLYCPTRLAVYRLARQRGLTPRRAARVSQEHPDPGDNDLARHLAHTVRVRDFFAHCYEAARAAGGELVAWQGESECEQRFLWQGAVQYLRPDGYGQLRLGGTVWPFYLEWDHGREWVPRYRDKFAAYYDCRASRAPYAIEGHFPTILVVTVAPAAAGRVRTAVRAEAQRRRESCLPARVTTTGLLHRGGLFAPIWWGPLADSPLAGPFPIPEDDP
ncbi:MAG: replication-relaxation family protein, partial [Chloroflexi bacterium]|nr:replication-relaxation family protein [Chloroflexota bacterium]